MATRKTTEQTEQTARLKKFEDLALRLHATASQLVRKSQASNRTSGLSTARLSALSTLVASSPVTLRTIAQLEHVRPPTMTRIVQGLEREGLVRRMDDATDKRRVFVITTPKGREVLEREQKRRIEPLALTIRCLHHTKLAQLTKVLRLLEELAASVREVVRPPSRPPEPEYLDSSPGRTGAARRTVSGPTYGRTETKVSTAGRTRPMSAPTP